MPLVVAAVDDDAAVFRLVSSHPKLLTLTALGSPAGVSLARLHDAAADLVLELGCMDHEERRARFADLAGTGRTAREPCELRAAVADGRIETLFVGDHTAFPAATMLQIVAGTLRTGGTVLASSPSDDVRPVRCGHAARLTTRTAIVRARRQAERDGFDVTSGVRRAPATGDGPPGRGHRRRQGRDAHRTTGGTLGARRHVHRARCHLLDGRHRRRRRGTGGEPAPRRPRVLTRAPAGRHRRSRAVHRQHAPGDGGREQADPSALPSCGTGRSSTSATSWAPS